MRQALVTIAAVALVLLLGWVGYTVVFDGNARAVVVVESVEGRVERSRPAEAPAAVSAGDPLSARDTLRVHGAGAATVSVGKTTRLRLAPDSALQVVDVADDGVRVVLEEGRVEANVRPDAPRVSITAAGRTTTATDAEFAVGLDGSALGVSVARGTVRVEGTTVAAGQTLSQAGEGTPTLRAADEDLLLQVAWPTAPTNQGAVRLNGTTEPGAQVTVAGGAVLQEVRADAQGSFAVEVPVPDGLHTLTVSARDPLGSEVSVSGGVEADATAPAAQAIDVSWGG